MLEYLATLPNFLVYLGVSVAMLTAFGVGLWLTALNVKYRDVSFIVPFLVQIWLYASPVAYSSSIVPARWKPLYGLNPMVGVVEGFRWALLGKTPPDPVSMASSLSIVVVLLVSGLWYFHKMERTFADLI